MAKKQTRRSVSLNCRVYDDAMKIAESRGQTLAGLVESALATIGVPIVAHPQQPVALAQANAARRAESMAARQDRRDRSRRPTRERQARGNQIADACGRW